MEQEKVEENVILEDKHEDVILEEHEHENVSLKDKGNTELLPLAYMDSLDKGVYWLCDYDENHKITSVFMGHGERYSAYLNNINDILDQEKKLVEVGWIKCKKPEINIKFDEKKLPRKIRRQLEKKREKQSK